MEDRLSFFSKNFWDFFLQKIFRNFSSAKYQWLFLLYLPTIIGMFSGKWVDDIWVSKISPSLGLGFLGAGFVTFATSRIIMNTNLVNKKDDKMDSDI